MTHTQAGVAPTMGTVAQTNACCLHRLDQPAAAISPYKPFRQVHMLCVCVCVVCI